jgi:hypothetical protein
MQARKKLGRNLNLFILMIRKSLFLRMAFGASKELYRYVAFSVICVVCMMLASMLGKNSEIKVRCSTVIVDL